MTTPRPTAQGETISAHETMSTDKTERAAYPPLPEMIDLGDSGASNYGYSEACMRAYVDADRKARASQPATVVPVVIAWVHEADPHHSISAPQKEQALRDGGASASSVRPYSVAAYAHPSAPAESGWQPIASAPKDGTRILIWQDNFWQPARWQSTATGAEPSWPVGWRTSLYVYPNVEWWAPLPAAPSAAQPGGADGGA